MTRNRRLLAGLACLLSSTAVLPAQERPTLQQLLDGAHKLSDISSLQPYVLRAGVIANPGDKDKERSGQLTIYRDRDRSRLELSLGKDQETRVVLGDRQYVPLATALFPATGLAMFDHSWLPPLRASGGVPVQVIKTRIRSQDAWLVELPEGSRSRQLFFDASRPALLSSQIGIEKDEFFDYAAVGAFWVPGRAVISRENLTPVELHDVQVLPGPLDASLFSVPPDSLEIETCANEKPAKALYQSEPQFPESERKRKRQGAVSLSVIVDKEGKLAAARVLDATSEAFAHQSLEAIHQWKFQPALCSGRPVNAETTVSFAFRLY